MSDVSPYWRITIEPKLKRDLNMASIASLNMTFCNSIRQLGREPLAHNISVRRSLIWNCTTGSVYCPRQVDNLIPLKGDPKSTIDRPHRSSRPTMSSSSFQTPRDYAKLLEYCHQLKEYIKRNTSGHNLSCKLFNKVCNAVAHKKKNRVC
jgi:hypothetical protein